MDDNIVVEKYNCKYDRVNDEGVKQIHVTRMQGAVGKIVREAERHDMRINAAKTKLLCISDGKGYKTRAHFYDHQGNEIVKSDKLKILGFNFSSKPNMTAQVNAILAGVR